MVLTFSHIKQKKNSISPLILWIIIIVLLLGSTTAAHTQYAQIRNFKKHTYGGASQNWSVAFDTTGLTYVGNNLGLLEFDGVSWRLYPSPNGSIIRAVAIDDNNKIYTCGYRELGFWQKKDEGNLEYHTLTPIFEHEFAANEEFWNILILDGEAYFQSFSGIYSVKGDSVSIVKPGGFISYTSVSDKHLLFAIQHRGIFRLEGDSYVEIIENQWFRDKTIRYVRTTDSSGEYLIATESHGLFLCNAATSKFVPWGGELSNYFIQNKINKVIENKHNELVIGTILDGISVINKEATLKNKINVKGGIQSNTVLGIGIDSFDNIWLALNTGIDFVSFNKGKAFFKVINEGSGALHTAAYYNNELYIGTNQGLYKSKSGLEKTEFELVPGTQEQVWDCKVVGRSLFVGHNAGTFLINEKGIQKISNVSGGYSIVRNPKNSNQLIQSTYSDLVVYSNDSGAWKFSHTINGFNNLIRYVEFDHLNNLWASHLYKGVYRLQLNQVMDSVLQMKYYPSIVDSSKQVSRTYVFKVQNRIVFTTGIALYTYNDLIDSIVPYDKLNHEIGAYAGASRIIPAPGNRYWFIADAGIACFKISMDVVKLDKEFPIELFEKHLIPLRENVVPIDANRALVCFENGYAILNTNVEQGGNEINEKQPRLQEFIVSDRQEKKHRVKVNETEIVIPFNKNNIALRYSFPLFSAEPVIFRYKVEELYDKWSEAQEKPIFNLKRIPSGNYTLRVKAMNNWGKTSREHQIKFTVKPPGYLSSMAILFYFMLLVFSAILLRYISVRKIKRKEKRKRHEKEKELIELRNEKLRAELSFKSQQLASSTMGIIKKNEFLLGLKERLRRQKEQLGTRYPDKYYLNIVNKIDANIANQNDWELFESNFEQAHEAFLLNLKSAYPELTSSDLRLCAYLRINLTSKEIAPLLGISVRGVENHRYRLRKKLKVASDENLTDFILSL